MSAYIHRKATYGEPLVPLSFKTVSRFVNLSAAIRSIGKNKDKKPHFHAVFHKREQIWPAT